MTIIDTLLYLVFIVSAIFLAVSLMGFFKTRSDYYKFKNAGAEEVITGQIIGYEVRSSIKKDGEILLERGEIYKHKDLITLAESDESYFSRQIFHPWLVAVDDDDNLLYYYHEVPLAVSDIAMEGTAKEILVSEGTDSCRDPDATVDSLLELHNKTRLALVAAAPLFLVTLALIIFLGR